MAICRYLGPKVANIGSWKGIREDQAFQMLQTAARRYRYFTGVLWKYRCCGKSLWLSRCKKVFSYFKERQGVNEIGCPLKGAKDILIEFTGRGSPDIYGISIEAKKWLWLSTTFPAGNAPAWFTMVGRDNLAGSYQKTVTRPVYSAVWPEHCKECQARLFIYQKGLERQLSLLKQISPSTPILVISVTIWLVNEGDSINRLRNIPSIIDPEKKLQRMLMFAFWDSYSAMEGSYRLLNGRKRTSPCREGLCSLFISRSRYPVAAQNLQMPSFSLKEIDTNRPVFYL